jgi:hypothetical protein
MISASFPGLTKRTPFVLDGLLEDRLQPYLKLVNPIDSKNAPIQ